MFVVCFLLIKMQQFIYIFPNHVILQIDLISWFFISKIGIFMVCGIMDTEMVSSLNLAIVRLIPSSAIDPFSIQYFMIFSGALIVNHTALSSCFYTNKFPCIVHMACYHMTSEPSIGCHRSL